MEHKAFGIAKVAAAKKIYLVTSMSGEMVRKLFAEKVASVRRPWAASRRREERRFAASSCPRGASLFPCLPRRDGDATPETPKRVLFRSDPMCKVPWARFEARGRVGGALSKRRVSSAVPPPFGPETGQCYNDGAGSTI